MTISSPQVLYNSENSIEIRSMTLSEDGRYLLAVITPFGESGEMVEEWHGAYLINTETWEREYLGVDWNNIWSHDSQYLVLGSDEARILNVVTGEGQVLGEFYVASWSADNQYLYLTEIAGLLFYEIATGETTLYLEEEGKVLEELDSYGLINVREQGTD